MTPTNLDAVQSLFYFDGPLSEVLRDRTTGALYYAHWVDVDTECHTWLVVPVTAEQLQLLGDARLFICDLLETPGEVFVGRHDGHRWHSMEAVPFAHLNPEWVPAADAILPRETWHDQEMR